MIKIVLIFLAHLSIFSILGACAQDKSARGGKTYVTDLSEKVTISSLKEDLTLELENESSKLRQLQEDLMFMRQAHNESEKVFLESLQNLAEDSNNPPTLIVSDILTQAETWSKDKKNVVEVETQIRKQKHTIKDLGFDLKIIQLDQAIQLEETTLQTYVEKEVSREKINFRTKHLESLKEDLKKVKLEQEEHQSSL